MLISLEVESVYACLELDSAHPCVITSPYIRATPYTHHDWPEVNVNSLNSEKLRHVQHHPRSPSSQK